MKVTKVVGNQRQTVDLDVRTPASFARVLRVVRHRARGRAGAVKRCRG